MGSFPPRSVISQNTRATLSTSQMQCLKQIFT